jgi:hypothetical protein
MSSELEKRKPLRYLVPMELKPQLDEVMLHPRIRWRTMGHRPVYSYRYNSGFMYYVGYLFSVSIALLMSLLNYRIPLIIQSEFIGFLFWSVLGFIGSIVGSFVLVHMLFFTDNKKGFRVSGLSSIVYLLLFFALSILFDMLVSDGILWFGSVPLSVLVFLLLFMMSGVIFMKIWKSFGRIKLYSDGFVIGSEVFDYSEIEYINYAAGPIESNIKEEHKSFPRIIMSEIEYSYKGKDYEIDHFYLVVVKQKRVYICQSIMFTSGFAANARNGLKHYNYMKEKGVLYKIFR